MVNSIESGMTGVDRKQAFSTGFDPKDIKMNDKPAQFTPGLAKEDSIQGYIIIAELKVLLDKALQLRFILSQGVRVFFYINTIKKMKPNIVIQKIPMHCLISMNSKLEFLCSLLYKISSFILQEFQAKPETIGIRSFRQKLEYGSTVYDEAENFNNVMNVLGDANEYLRSSIVVYEAMLKEPTRKSFPYILFTQLEQLTYKCRLTVNNIEKEYYVYEDYLLANEEKTEEQIREEEKMRKNSKEPVQAHELKDFIDNNLHKIYAKHEIYSPLSVSLHRRYFFRV